MVGRLVLALRNDAQCFAHTWRITDLRHCRKQSAASSPCNAQQVSHRVLFLFTPSPCPGTPLFSRQLAFSSRYYVHLRVVQRITEYVIASPLAESNDSPTGMYDQRNMHLYMYVYGAIVRDMQYTI